MAIFCVKYAGYLLKQDYQDGSRVGAGQLLFEIDPRQYQATLDQALGNLAQAEAQLKQNQTDPARYTKLFKSSVIPAQQFDNSTQTTRPSAARVAVYGAFLGLWSRRLNNATGRSSISPPRI